MNTWLSGMSPVAAAFASAWSAPAEGVVVAVAAVLVAAEMVGGADIAGVTVFLPPQPVSAKAALSVLAIKVVYTTRSAPNAVTGKRVTLTVDRYYLERGGKVATIDLGTPVGVDNVDAYRLMIQSFRWR